jgi:hypothetical protein
VRRSAILAQGVRLCAIHFAERAPLNYRNRGISCQLELRRNSQYFPSCTYGVRMFVLNKSRVDLSLLESILPLMSGFSAENGNRFWLTMLQAYIGDSGNVPEHKVFVLGGFVSTPDRWRAFSDEWIKALQLDPPLRYFKNSEARRRAGEFECGWHRDLIDQRIAVLTDVAIKYALLRTHCLMRWDHYQSFIKDIGDNIVEPYGSEFRNPYLLCFMGIAGAIELHKRHVGLDVPHELIFDEHGAIGQHSAFAWSLLNYANLKEILFGNPPIFRDDKIVLPLQAADLYSSNVHNLDFGTMVGEDCAEYIKARLATLPSIITTLDARQLGSIRESLFESARDARLALSSYS